MVRRIIVTDNEASLARHLGVGESLLVADAKNGTDLLAARAAIKAAIGVDPPTHDCAVVDKNGQVTRMIAADPELDAIPGSVLVKAYKGVTKECTYDTVSDTFTAPTKVIPAGVDFLGNPYPEKTVGGLVPKPSALTATAEVDAQP